MIADGSLQRLQSSSEPEETDDTTRKIMEHLMFHKSLVDDGDDGTKYEHYMELVKNMDSQMMESENAFDRGVSRVMKLVTVGQMDPWNIDLLEFSKIYLRQLRSGERIDLYTAGKITLMAWSVLRMQSEDALHAAELKKAEEDYPFYGWDVADFQSVESTPEWSPENSDEIMISAPDAPPIRPRMRHTQQRTVTLVELAEAFGEAYMEAELNTTVRRISKKPTEKRAFRNPTHKEDLEADMKFTLERIKRFEAGPISLTDLYEPGGGKDEFITLFSSLLFLEKEGTVHVWQKDLPYGEIYAELRVPFEIANMEDAVDTVSSALQPQPIPLPDRL